MNHLMRDFLGKSLSRRGFVQALTALGVSAAGVKSLVQAAEAAEKAEDHNGAPVARTVKGTGGEIMVAQMKAAGVRYVFTNPGSYEVGFFDALLDDKDVTLIMGLHEGLVIAMADGYHKVSGKPAFVNVHVIAGTAQAAGQMYNASRDHSALVVTAGLLDNEVYNDDGILSPRPGYNQKDVNRQFTKISYESHDPAGVAVMLRRAFKIAAAAPGGPVYIAFPNTVLETEATADVYDAANFMLPTDVPPNRKHVVKLAELLLAAKRPALLLGDEVTRFHAQPEVLALAEAFHIPVHESVLPAFHNFPRRHPLFNGKFVASDPKRGGDWDLVINVGDFDLGDYDVTENIQQVPKRPVFARGTKIVRFGLDADSLGRTNAFSLAFVANVKLTLQALLDEVKAKAPPADKYPPREVKILPERQGLAPIHPDELTVVLDEMLDKNAIVVSENLSGSNHFFNTGFRPDEKMWVSNSSAGLGWGIGAATGAKLAAPDRQVVCNIGDGSVMYSAAGFWTQARYKVPVLTVVCNNRNYQTVRNAYTRYPRGKMRQAGRYVLMHLGDPNIDFVQLAASQGVEGVRVERKKKGDQDSTDLRKALEQGIKATRAGRPFLVEVVVQNLRKQEHDRPEWFEAFSLADQKGK